MGVWVVVGLMVSGGVCARMVKGIGKGDEGEGKKGLLGWFKGMLEKRREE